MENEQIRNPKIGSQGNVRYSEYVLCILLLRWWPRHDAQIKMNKNKKKTSSYYFECDTYLHIIVKIPNNIYAPKKKVSVRHDCI